MLKNKTEQSNSPRETLEDLRRQFPDVHEHVIIKADLLRNGIAPTEDLQKIGEWSKSDSDNVFDFHRVSLKERGRVQDGRLLHPESLVMNDDTVVKLMLDETSPYTVITNQDLQKHHLLYQGEQLLEAHFIKTPKWYDLKTTSGKLMSALGFIRGHCSFSTIIYHHCEFFEGGNQCRYCNMDFNTRRMGKMGRGVPMEVEPQDIEEVARAAYKECAGQIAHWGGSGGSRWNRDAECNHYVSIIKAIKKGIDKPEWTTLWGEWDMQAMDDDQHQRLYDTNIEAIGHNLEVYGESEFARTCPGKQKNVGYKGWLESLFRAVREYWGHGKVTSNVVAGIELSEQNGHTYESGLKHAIAGFEHLITEGVMPRFGLWQANPGSPWINDPSCPPPASYHLQLGLAHHDMMKTYGMHPNPTGTCYRDLDRVIYQDFYHLM